MHEEGFRKALTNVRQPLRPGQGPPQGEGREPPRRGHPRGPHRHHLGAAARAAVRGPDQGQARQPVIMRSLVERATNEKLGRVARGAPHRGQQDRQEGDRRRPGPAWPPARPATPPAASPRSSGAGMPDKLKDCSARGTPTSASCSSSRATPPAARPSRPATRASRRSCPIRGKILNVERARLDKMLKNDEIQALISAIGAGVGEEFDVDEDPLRQDHPAGRRRRRRLPHPHAAAHVLLPPDAAARRARATSTSPSRRCTPPRSARTKIYLKDDAAKDAFLEPSNPNHKKEFSRLKGLGEMDWRGARRHHDGSRPRARCCRCRSSRPPSPTRSSRRSWATTSSRARHFIQTNAKDVRFLDI